MHARIQAFMSGHACNSCSALFMDALNSFFVRKMKKNEYVTRKMNVISREYGSCIRKTTTL